MNKYGKYLHILPEDDAYKELANGFFRHPQSIARAIQVITPTGGWVKLKNHFAKKYVKLLQRNQGCHVLMLLDLDGKPNRYDEMLDDVPSALKDRVFVLSALNEAEDIKRELKPGSNENIGEMLANSCYDSHYAAAASPWSSSQLKHNQAELRRLSEKVRSFLFIESDAYFAS